MGMPKKIKDEKGSIVSLVERGRCDGLFGRDLELSNVNDLLISGDVY